jgi:Leucine-rich repeat (LRR) protein
MKNIVILLLFFATIAEAQIVNIPDANFKAKLIQLGVDTNNDGNIQTSEALQITNLNVSNSQITSLDGILSFTNLVFLNCSNNQLTTLNLQGMIDFKSLDCDNNQLSTLNLQALTNFEVLHCENNQLTSLNLQSLTNLKYLYCRNNQISNINIQGLLNLFYFYCDNNQITSLNLQGLNSLNRIYCDNNQLSTIDLQGLTNLGIFKCDNNQISNLNFQGLGNVNYISCVNNQISVINVQGLNQLSSFYCSNNQLTSLNLQDLISLEYLYCSNNQLTSFNVQGCTFLNYLNCSNNQLTTLDLQYIPMIYEMNCSSNFLQSLNIKNGFDYYNFDFSNNPNLQFICCNDSQFNSVQQAVIANGQTNCQVNTYCSFVPGGVFYTIQGNTKLDNNSNGCDILDIDFPNLNFTITNGTTSGSLISNTSGNYSIPVQAGSHTITPVFENPTYFNISPASFVANFPTQTSPLVQDFCVTANGVHHDVEVTFVPTNPARPGFDANYTIIYKNKGNQVENGAVTLDFNDAVLDLVSANPVFSSQATNSLVWNYTNLQPFETRTINLVFNVNSPTETPAVNIGDVLNFTASITPLSTDEFVSDNTSTLNQIVVGSYDPNDKTCIEGITVGPDMIGQYVHYVIRFENTGTYPAENVVVKDLIDLAKFDVNTLIPLHSSHDFVTRIAGNKIEFIFEGINLPFDDANNDGYVAFKIKTKSNLVIGDTFSNNANIYFDYNFPITTNTFTTTIQVLKVKDFEFGTHFTLYPNPVKDVLNLQSKDNTTINSIEIYNTLGQVVLAIPNAVSAVDLSNLQSGNYFVKVNTDLGVSNTKFIKE